ncbi:MAG: T9SS type A sorting domain-containing protein [Ignavibacterium sp.]|nr:T9SS type A sorting domain-containing protein [Ignavibacterium sp.]
MKLQVILLLILLSGIFSQIQSQVDNYKLNTEADKFYKTNSQNPTSNTITDMIALGDTVWLGTSRGVSLSTDRGETWTNFFGNPQFGTDNVSSIGYYNGVLWAATARTVEQNNQRLPQGTGLKYTSDLGRTWNSIPQPLDDPSDSTVQYGINTLRALPVTVAVQNLAYDIAFTPGTIWIATFAGGLRKSIDMGQSWKRVVLPPDSRNSIMPTDELNFCLSPVPGNFCSVGNLNHRVFSVIATDDNTLYAGTANGVNKSTDNGISWVKFNHQNQDEPISGNFITALGFNNTNNTLWASTWKAEDPDEFYGVSYSTNGGESWKTTLREERPHNFGFKQSQTIVATGNGAFRTRDGGKTWITPGSIFDPVSDVTLNTNVFFSAASQGADVWLGSDDGLAKIRETGFWQGTWKVFIASAPLSAEDDTYCYPNPFSPRQDQLKIKYSTGNKDADVTIRVYDFAMNYVSTVIQNAQRNKNIESAPDYWDGRDANGNFVPNGVYIYRVEVEGKEPVFDKVIVLQ